MLSMQVYKEQRVCILVDVQNMYYSAKNLYNCKVNFNEILKDALKGRKLMRALAYVIKADVRDEHNFHDALNKIGFEIKSKELLVFHGGNKKGDWDVGIAMDAVRAAEKVDTIVVVSGDGDFKELYEYVRGKGCRIEVMAFGKTASSSIKDYVDHFIDMDKYTKYLIPLKPQKNNNSNNNNNNNNNNFNNGHNVNLNNSSNTNNSHSKANMNHKNVISNISNNNKNNSKVNGDNKNKGNRNINEKNDSNTFANINQGNKVINQDDQVVTANISVNGQVMSPPKVKPKTASNIFKKLTHSFKSNHNPVDKNIGLNAGVSINKKNASNGDQDSTLLPKMNSNKRKKIKLPSKKN
ncbi:MAG: NYN domain-containing protein [Candidatus Woesearchaeota archaeon]